MTDHSPSPQKGSKRPNRSVDRKGIKYWLRLFAVMALTIIILLPAFLVGTVTAFFFVHLFDLPHWYWPIRVACRLFGIFFAFFLFWGALHLESFLKKRSPGG